MMKFSIYKKMMLGFGAIISIMIISSGYVLSELNSVASGAKDILASNVQSLSIAREVQALVQDENEYIEKYQVSDDRTYFSLFAETSSQVNDKLNLLEQKQSSKKNLEITRHLQSLHNTLVQFILKTPDEQANIEQIRKKNISGLSVGLKKLIKLNQSYVVEKISDIEVITARSVRVAGLLIISTLVIAVTMAFLITRTITRPISDLILGTRQIGRGNFEKIKISSADEMALLADAVNDMSEKINESNTLKTQMMQQISHEIKTPLQAILASHDVLKASQAVEKKQRHLLDAIARSVNTIAGYSKQYLDLAKIESGAVQYDMQLSDLCDIVCPIIDEAKIIALSKNIEIKTVFEPAPKIFIDPEKMSIIVNNLISNAIKYTRNDGKIKVSVGPCDIGAQIEVSDSGIGIDTDDIPNIFIRFYQARNRNKIESQGSGVGLAIVKAYTQGHGGKVFVNSSPDKGSAFSVHLPVNRPPKKTGLKSCTPT